MKKRRVFDLDFPDELPDAPSKAKTLPVGKSAGSSPEAKVVPPHRRGPMAEAVHENAEALRNRSTHEAAIRAENDALAEDLVRLKREGLVVDLIPVDAIDTNKLVRDRAQAPDAELADLKSSIQELGLSNPIRVERKGPGRYELIQGMRRLTAYRELLHETEDPKYACIPAGLMADGESLEGLYRRMVDENLVRKDISFAEMANLARTYAADPETDCSDTDKAVAILFKSASYTKRSYIRAFAAMLDAVGEHLFFPTEIPRNLGVDVRRRMEAEPRVMQGIIADLKDWESRTAQDEIGVLRRWAGAGEGDSFLPLGKKSQGPTSAGGARKAKVTIQMSRPEGAAKCTASNGRLEVRLPLDFSTVPQRQLESALSAFLDKIGKKA